MSQPSSLSCTALFTARQINGGANVNERVGRWLNALNPWNRVKNNLLLLGRISRRHRAERDGAQRDQLAILWPLNSAVVSDIAGVGDLDDNVKLNGALLYKLRDRVECVIDTEGFELGVVHMRLACSGNDAIANKSFLAVLVDQLEGVDAVELLGGKAHWRGLWRFNKGLGGGVRGDKVGDCAVGKRREETHGIFAVLGWEEWRGVGDNVGMDAAWRLLQHESQGEATGVGVRVIVGYLRKASKAGESGKNWGRLAMEVRCS